MTDIESLEVEVAYALPHKQKIVSLLVEPGTTVLQAARRSGLDKEFPELDIEAAAMGIFGQAVKKPGEQVLQAGDRVEIYRPLTSDPKDARRRRAEKAKKSAD